MINLNCTLSSKKRVSYSQVSFLWAYGEDHFELKVLCQSKSISSFGKRFFCWIPDLKAQWNGIFWRILLAKIQTKFFPHQYLQAKISLTNSKESFSLCLGIGLFAFTVHARNRNDNLFRNLQEIFIFQFLIKIHLFNWIMKLTDSLNFWDNMRGFFPLLFLTGTPWQFYPSF